MHIPESQRTFLDKVKEVLQKYDAILKDINHKVNSEMAIHSNRRLFPS